MRARTIRFDGGIPVDARMLGRIIGRAVLLTAVVLVALALTPDPPHRPLPAQAQQSARK